MIELKRKLKDNPEYIEKILYHFGFYHVDITSKEVRCAFNDTTNATSVRVKLEDNLMTNDFARDIHGDLFHYIVLSKGVLLRDVIEYAKRVSGMGRLSFSKQVGIFGGAYDKLKPKKVDAEVKTYDESVMKDYLHRYTLRFLKDGISLSTQRKFKVGLDFESNRISVPWFNHEGKLVGIEGRYSGDHLADEQPKWFPIIPFNKSKFLFGYNTNYFQLQSCDEVYVGESSKFVMQLDSLKINNAVAVGGNSIHNEQIRLLGLLNVKRIIICFDEGLELDVIVRQVEKIKMMLRFKGIKVGYVHDFNNEIMEKGSKCSPSDLGLESFNKLIKNYVKWSEDID